MCASKQSCLSKHPSLDIVLFDANSYFASCHQAINPELRNKPLLIAGEPKNRTGIILTASYEARKFGIKTAMPLFEALRRCPQAVVLPPDFRLYMELSEKMWQIVGRYTDQEHLEVVSVDECFADFSGSHLIFGSTEDIARRIQAEIWQELSLGVTVGISYCKILAKLASDYEREPQTRIKKPRSFTVFSKDDLLAKVWPLPVSEMSGIGAQLEKRLGQLGIKTIGDLAQYPDSVLRKQLGVYGGKIHEWANGIDTRPVTAEDQARNHSIGRSITLPEDLTDPEQIAEVLLTLSDSVGRRVRKEQAKARTVSLTVKDAKFKTRNFSIALHPPSDSTDVFYRESLRLFREKWPPAVPVRLLGVTADRLQKGIEQLSLFQEEIIEQTELERTVDSIREKYGAKILVRGTQLLRISRNIAERNDKER